MSISLEVTGLDEIEQALLAIPQRATDAARIALNDTMSGPGLVLLRTDTQEEVNFPAGYVDKEKLYLKQRAQNNKLEVRIAARARATSLARFAQAGTKVNGKAGVNVQVHRGKTIYLKRAFLIKLRSGATALDNIGLAIRLKPGERLQNSDKAINLGKNLYLLYGPSVDQVLYGVATKDTQQVLGMIGVEFRRQMQRTAGFS